MPLLVPPSLHRHLGKCCSRRRAHLLADFKRLRGDARLGACAWRCRTCPRPPCPCWTRPCPLRTELAAFGDEARETRREKLRGKRMGLEACLVLLRVFLTESRSLEGEVKRVGEVGKGELLLPFVTTAHSRQRAHLDFQKSFPRPTNPLEVSAISSVL
jgi:hypothetical protein